MEQFFNIFGPGVFAFIGGAFGGYLTSEWNFRNQLKTTTWEKRQQAYSEIMGLRFLQVETVHQAYQAKILQSRDLWRWAKSEFKDSSHLSEADRYMIRHENLILEVARTNERLFKSIGLAKGTFPISTELDSKVDLIYRHPIFEIPNLLPQTANTKEIITWTDSAKQDLQKFLFEKLVMPIDGLLKYLKEHIEDEIK